MAVADRPQPRHEDEDDRVEDDRVGHREEAADRAEREHRRRHRDERVGRVEVAAEQEPGDPGAELAPAEAPLVEATPCCRPRRSGVAMKPSTVTTAKSTIRTVSATPLTPPCRRRARAVIAASSRGRVTVRGSPGHRPVRAGLEDEPVGGVGQRGAEEDPEELVPEEEREAPELGVLPSRSCSPRAGRDRDGQQDAGEGQQALVGRGDGVVVDSVVGTHLRTSACRRSGLRDGQSAMYRMPDSRVTVGCHRGHIGNGAVWGPTSGRGRPPGWVRDPRISDPVPCAGRGS